jgi:hypothetical protein
MMATESLNVAENKATASGAACKYLKCPLVPAFLTTALLASATTPTSRRHIPFGDAYARPLRHRSHSEHGA